MMFIVFYVCVYMYMFIRLIILIFLKLSITDEILIRIYGHNNYIELLSNWENYILF